MTRSTPGTPTRASSTPASNRRCSATSSAGWPSGTSGWRARASAASCPRRTTTCSRSTRSSPRRRTSSSARPNTIALDGWSLVSTGWANPTPWKTFRELPEDELRARIDGLVEKVADPRRSIFNFHAPPYGSNLDNAPKLDADMKYVAGGQALVPVGSRAVRDAITAYAPVLSLHGHIHEGRGAVNRCTLAVNRAARTRMACSSRDRRSRRQERRVKRYLLING